MIQPRRGYLFVAYINITFTDSGGVEHVMQEAAPPEPECTHDFYSTNRLLPPEQRRKILYLIEMTKRMLLISISCSPIKQVWNIIIRRD
ncbi:MAG: hypothetical protein BWY70_01827 [Bacteroidetes bacterium ADurb.Bin408]|nr:MAG: hypothetical protein BWY70_01827 [Bacteroidetes bacterium ADurb.Bin408]